MTGKVTGRAGAKCSDTQSMFSMGSMRTVDREKLRDKARHFQIKENLRLAMCARIQQQLKKAPKLAEELASEVLKVLQQRGLPPDLSDDALAGIVRELSARRQEQLALASASKGAESEDTSRDDATGRTYKAPSGRRSSGTKDRSARSGGGGNSKQQQRKPSGKGPVNGDAGIDEQEDVYLSQSQLQQLSTGFCLPPRVPPKKEKNNGIWEEIVKFSSVEEQLEAQRKQELKQRQRAELSERLNSQVHQKHQHRALEKEASKRFHRENMQRLGEVEQDEHTKGQQRVERAKQLIVIQNEQRLAKMKQYECEQRLAKMKQYECEQQLKKA